MDTIIREIDDLGRIVIPKPWRKSLGKEVILCQIGAEVRVKPRQAKKFSQLPRVEVDLAAKLSDWHAVESELSK